MNKKFITCALALTMLAQTVISAAPLSDFVGTNITGGGLFEYNTAIKPVVSAQVSISGEDNYKDSESTREDTFDFKASLDMTEVKAAFDKLYDVLVPGFIEAKEPANKASLLAAFDASVVTGTFTVTTTYDENLTLAGTPAVGDIILMSGNTTSPYFTVDSVTVNNNVMTVIFSVASGITVGDIAADGSKHLDDLSVVINGVKAERKGRALEVIVAMTGSTTISDADTVAWGEITYATDPATAEVLVRSSGSGGGTTPPYQPDQPTASPAPTESPDPIDPQTPSVTVIVDGVKKEYPLTETEDGKKIFDIETVEKPAKEGFVFEGWYDTSYFTNPVSGIIEVTGPVTIYSRFVNITPPTQMNADDHMAYIAGYPDGEVKPNNQITREEVVAALYRLLKPEFRATIDTDETTFPDVEAGRWSYASIAAFQKAGFIVGNNYGEFEPARPITRAEFVTIVDNMAPFEVAPVAYFSDIDSHWAKDAIMTATSLAWITGYEDGTFRPNGYITRAEAMTIINQMLVRYGDISAEFAKQWPDVAKTDWFYGAVIEATTDNDYTRNEDGWSETWIAPAE